MGFVLGFSLKTLLEHLPSKGSSSLDGLDLGYPDQTESKSLERKLGVFATAARSSYSPAFYFRTPLESGVPRRRLDEGLVLRLLSLASTALDVNII